MRQSLALCVFAVLFVSPVQAQNPDFGRPPGIGTPGYRPPVSPYLNLNRGGSAAINYFGVVRPQMEGANMLQRIEQQINPPPNNGIIGFDPQVAVAPGMMAGAAGTVPVAVGANQGFGIGVVQPAGGVYPTAAGYMTHNRFYMTVAPGATPGGGGGGGGNMSFGQPQRNR